MKPSQLREHVAATYHSIRMGIALVAIALPLLLWIGGALRAGLPLQQSMSAYYHSVMRDVFVGVLCAVGVVLYLYKGFTRLENYALNLAGLFVVGAALVPMEADGGASDNAFSWHGTFAVLFFLSIAYVCIYRASDTLTEVKDEQKRQRYRRAYKMMGLAMVVSPLLAVLLTLLLQPGSEARSTKFLIETFAVLVFGSYWIVKSFEIKGSKVDRRAIQGELCTREYGPKDAFKQIPVQQQAPGPASQSSS